MSDNGIEDLLEEILRRLDLLDDSVFGFGFIGPDPVPGPSGAGSVDYLGVLRCTLDSFSNASVPSAPAFLSAIAGTLDEVSLALGGVIRVVLDQIADVLESEAEDLPPRHMSGIQFGTFLGSAAEMAYQFENEPGRDESLTFGEFCYCIGSSMHQYLRPGLFVYVSSVAPIPGGLRKAESWGSLLGNIQGMLFSLARWNGVFGGPKVPRGPSEPIDWASLPYSVAGG